MSIKRMPGHTLEEQNEQADKLAKLAAKLNAFVVPGNLAQNGFFIKHFRLRLCKGYSSFFFDHYCNRQ